MTSCRYHCGECGRHFSSLRGFDKHREGPWDARRCKPVRQGTPGQCSIMDGEKRVATVHP